MWFQKWLVCSFNDLCLQFATARGTIQIDRKTADGKVPLNVAVINGLNNSEGDAEVDKKVTIPDWLTPKNIYNHFGNQPIKFDY